MEDKKVGAFVSIDDIYDKLLDVDKKVDNMRTAFWVAGLVGVPAISTFVSGLVTGAMV